MTKKNSINPIKSPQLLLFIAFIFGLVLIQGLQIVSSTFSSLKAEEVWIKLKDKSEAHRLVVTSYRECRTNSFIGGSSQAECLSSAIQLAEIGDPSGDYKLVLKDIDTARVSISKILK